MTSRARQLAQAAALVAGLGVIVAEFFDVGQSRALAWACRPQAGALLAALADPGRGWDAIVIGEYERAFYGSQYAATAPLLEHYGVQLWMPETGGRVDFASEHDEQAMTVLGLSSKREIIRTSIRVRTAMAAQTKEQGRYLGGRPPYGYRLADAGPHPNKAHAAWGRRAWRLEPDPQTAPVVQWMFAQRLAGHSVARIARALNEAGIPCPSAADPRRNPHRTGAAWTLGTVATILANPRYTGRQVWNRQRTDTELADPANTSLGHKSVQRRDFGVYEAARSYRVDMCACPCAAVRSGRVAVIPREGPYRGPGRSGAVAERVGDLGEQVLELLQSGRADPAGEFLVEVVEDARAGVGFVPPAFGEADKGGPPVRGVGPPFHVAVVFEVVHQVADGLVGELCPLGQLADPRSVGSQVLEDGHVGGADVIESHLLQAGLHVLHDPVVAGPHEHGQVVPGPQPGGMGRGLAA